MASKKLQNISKRKDLSRAFEYCNTSMSCAKYNSSLSSYLKLKYKKNDPNMYEKLLDSQSTAIRRSERLLKMHSGATLSSSNPATTVHLLVKELNKYLKK
ncbi:MAG: RloB domain-containing protein [Lentisphaeria bacterium]